MIAGLTKIKPEDRILDLGTGCGVILLILAFRNKGSRLVGLEIQPEMAALARRNVEINGYSDRVRIQEGDLKRVADYFPSGSFDLLVSNPPYRRVDTGRVNPERQKAVARHELASSVSDVFAAGKYLLPHGGRLSVIYPASRLDHLLITAGRHGFSAKDLTVIHSHATGPGRLALAEFRKGGGEELRVSPPFFIYRDDGSYTDAMQKLYEEQGLE